MASVCVERSLRFLLNPLRYGLLGGRYPLSPVRRFLFFPFTWFSTSEFAHNGSKPSAKIAEQFVLGQLSELLPIDPGISRPGEISAVSTSDCDDERLLSGVDGFLSDAEKLRGVFLQKLVGTARVESALAATGVEVTEKIVKEVVNKGNLSGQAMVLFFRWAVKQPPFPKDLRSYNIVLKALGRKGFLNQMEELTDELKKNGLCPGSETLSIVIDSYVRARRVSKAVQFIECLEEFGLSCDCQHFNILLECLCLRSHARMADSLVRAMQGKVSCDKITYNILIAGWARLGRVKEIERSWNEMVNNGFKPEPSTFSYLIEGLGRSGRVQESVDVFHSMEDKGCNKTTLNYNALIYNFAAVGALDECLKYYHEMLQKDCCPPNEDTYAKLISSFLKARRVADAIELFDAMLGRGIAPSTGTVTSFMEPLCSFGPPHAALLIYDKSKGAGCEISIKTYKLLLRRLARFGKCGIMMRIWEEMIESGKSSDVEVYEYLVNGFCNIGQLENAVHVMEESLSKGFCPNKVIYSKLNNKLLNACKVEIAYRLFLKMKRARSFENARKFWRSNGWHF
uniref:Pentacotripeptide-repeat region of PRORP domain-containing protein n=1 Tax=Nymphaea colorata TaxID=210225 RepID=A0A5K1GG96_9MAGN